MGPSVRLTGGIRSPYGPVLIQGKKSVYSGTKKEPKPKLLSPDIFWWGRGLPREGVGAKKFDTSLETQGIKLFWRDIPGFCRDIPEAPEKFEKKMFGFNFLAPIYTTTAGPLFSPSVARPRGHRAKKAMVYTIFLGKQGKRVYTIGPERRAYTIEPQTRKKREKKGGVSTVVVYTFFVPLLIV